jgi:ABC-type transport system substrate-binding protein
VSTPIELMANDSWPYQRQTGELVQAMWSEVGYKVNYNIYDAAILRQKRRDGEFHADSRAGAYRFDPDGHFSRYVLSTAPQNQQQASRFRNEKADQLILQARRTADLKKRLELYPFKPVGAILWPSLVERSSTIWPHKSFRQFA